MTQFAIRPRGPKRVVVRVLVNKNDPRPVTEPKYVLELLCGHRAYRGLLRGSASVSVRCKDCWEEGRGPAKSQET